MQASAQRTAGGYVARGEGAAHMLGALPSALTARLGLLGVVALTRGGEALAGVHCSDVLVFDARETAPLSAWPKAARPRLVVVASEDTSADALDALEAGADEVIGGDAEYADLCDALFPNAPARESGGMRSPRLADLGVKMATIASEIEALLHPSELRPVEQTAPLGEIVAAPTSAQVRSLIRVRRARANYFSADLFADPAWTCCWTSSPRGWRARRSRFPAFASRLLSHRRPRSGGSRR